MIKTSCILIVDDEKPIQRSLKRSFFGLPYTIFMASSGGEALELLKDNQIDLILSDFKMPGMDGVEFFKQVREQHPGILRIMLSGFIDKDKLMESLFQFLVVSLFPKPWNEERLHRKIKECLELKNSIEDPLLWEKINSHNLSSLITANYRKTDKLLEYIECEPGIYSGLLHLYNSEYYNGGQQLDAQVIEQHFTSESIRALIPDSKDRSILHPFDSCRQRHSQILNIIYSRIVKKRDDVLSPSLLNIFRYITYICDKEMFEKYVKNHFFINFTKTEGYVFTEAMPDVLYYSKVFLDLWDVADPLLNFAKTALELQKSDGFSGMGSFFKLILIIDYYLEDHKDLTLEEIEKLILKDSVLQKLYPAS